MVKLGLVLLKGGSGREGNIEEGLVGALFRGGSGAGLKGELVQGNIGNAAIVNNHGLGAVAVVNIPV